MRIVTIEVLLVKVCPITSEFKIEKGIGCFNFKFNDSNECFKLEHIQHNQTNFRLLILSEGK